MRAKSKSISVYSSTQIKEITLETEFNVSGDIIYTLVTVPEHGSVTINNNIASYTPETDYIGTDTFTYKATDNSGTTAPATITIENSNL